MKLWLLAVLLLFNGPQTTQLNDAVLERISNVAHFAFGPTGYVGATSSGEKDYQIILSRKSALADFQRLYADGNVQAKSYALVGIHKLDRKRFSILVRTLRTSNEKVATMRGCILSEERLGEIIKKIDAGKYGR